MRLLLSLSLVLLTSFAAAPAFAAEALAPEVPSPTGGLITKRYFGTLEVQPRHFVVDCRLNPIVDGKTEKTISNPRVTVPAGEKATIAIQTQSPFVTGTRDNSAGSNEPVVTVLTAGIDAEVQVTALDDQSVQVDVAIKHTKISDVQEIESPSDPEQTLQAPVTSAHEIRTVRAVRLGEKVEVSCGCPCCKSPEKMMLEITVDEVDPEEAAITPLSAADARKAEIEDNHKFFTDVYIVAGLLEPHAIKKRDEELEEADFLPIIETVLREALVSWPEDAAIRPWTKKRALEITQTRKGHLEISQVLRDKRDHMADVQKLLRR